MNAVGTIGKVSKAIPAGTFFEAGIKAFDTFTTAKTAEEKAEGYGGAAGGLAGSVAGAAAGAAIGSVVPIIGTAVGGLVGAFLGGMGGDTVGACSAKRRLPSRCSALMQSRVMWCARCRQVARKPRRRW